MIDQGDGQVLVITSASAARPTPGAPLDPAVRAKLETQVPLGRVGTMEEFAHFCAPFVDGTRRFHHRRVVAYAGRWA